MSIGSRSVVLQRRLTIADRIRRHGITRVEALSAELGVSVVTIRGDLAYLEEQGLVVRSAGQARPNPAADIKVAALPGLSRSDALPMLRIAAGLMDQDMTVLLGAGSLTRQLIPHLPTGTDFRLVLSDLNALAIARACMDGSLHLLGGELDRDSNTLDGTQSLHALGLHVIGLFVLQVQAISSAMLLLPPGASELFHRAAARRASRAVALVDGNGLHTAVGLPPFATHWVDHVILPAGAHREAIAHLLDTGFRQVPLPDTTAYLFNKTK
ncbi:MAG: DeoR family transcriptional regulator [Janthinobacterium lividum]